jgi:hypothetical protein
LLLSRRQSGRVARSHQSHCDGIAVVVHPYAFPGFSLSNLTTIAEENYNIKFILDNGKVAEMEFYLVDDLECDLVVFHPYRTLLALCKKESASSNSEEGETVDPGIGISDGPRYWGTGEGQLEFTAPALQTAWYAFFLPSARPANIFALGQ